MPALAHAAPAWTSWLLVVAAILIGILIAAVLSASLHREDDRRVRELRLGLEDIRGVIANPNTRVWCPIPAEYDELLDDLARSALYRANLVPRDLPPDQAADGADPERRASRAALQGEGSEVPRRGRSGSADTRHARPAR